MRRSLPPVAPFAFALLALLALFCVEAAAVVARADGDRRRELGDTVDRDSGALMVAQGLPREPTRFEERLRLGAWLQKIGPREIALSLANLPASLTCPRCLSEAFAPRQRIAIADAEQSLLAHPPRAPPWKRAF